MTLRPDDAAVAALYDTYGDLVFRTCRTILSDHHDAEDAAQEVFAKLLIRWDASAVRDERRWLLEVTRNHCYDRLRAAARRPTVPVDTEPILARPADDPEQCSLLRAQLRWLLSLLPDRQREVVVRQAMLDQDLDTVADRLGLSYGAAAQLMYRARRQLATAADPARAGVAVVGSRLAELRTRLRDLGLRALSAGRELLSRGPIFDAAVALPIAVLVAVLGAASNGAVRPTTAQASTRAAALTAAPRAHSHAATAAAAPAAAIASTATALRNKAGNATPPGVKVATKNLFAPRDVNLPSPPPQAAPLLQCVGVGTNQVCPKLPSKVTVSPTMQIEVGGLP